MRRAAAYLAAAACLTGLLTGCGGGAAVSGENDDPLSGLTPAGSMELSYAEQFTVDTFEGGLSLITIGGEDRYLVVPEGQQAPQTGADITVLQQPLDSIYLVATSAMDFFVSLDALDTISLRHPCRRLVSRCGARGHDRRRYRIRRQIQRPGL